MPSNPDTPRESFLPKWLQDDMEAREAHAELAGDRLRLMAERIEAIPLCECNGSEPHRHIPVASTYRKDPK